MRHDTIIASIGHTPLVRLRMEDAPEVAVYAKLELLNPFGMKDRVAKHIITEARRTGDLAEGAPIVESSSGTMALGLALVGRHLGHPVHIVTDPRIDPLTLSKLEVMGCHVHIVEAMSGSGWQSARLERLAELMDELPRAFWPRQYENPGNPRAYRPLAKELLAELGYIDTLVGSVGSGGSLCGTSRALLERLPDLHVVAIDAVGSMLFAQRDRPQRRQSGLGNSLQPPNVDYSVVDEVHWLSDGEAFAATRALAREQQIYAGNSSGSVYQVLRHLARTCEPGSTIVGILPDRGDRYVESIFAEEDTLDTPAAPTRVTYGTQVSSWSCARLGRGDRRQLAFVEANTTGTGMAALRLSARLGVEPVFFTNDPKRYAGLVDTACRVIECDTSDPTSLQASLKAEMVEPAGVITTSDFYLLHVAELAESFGLPGNPADAISMCRNKALTREALHAAGVGQPRFAVVRSETEVTAAVQTVGLPCVIKPVDDSGSNNVKLCHTVEQAREHTTRILSVTTNVRGQAVVRAALVEQYLTGPEFSVEMFSHDGDAVCLGITEKSVLGDPYFVEYRHVFPAELPDETSSRIAATVREALRATGIRRGATHVEVRLEPDGPAIIEINARLAGGMIPELIRLATGVDVLEQQLRAFCDLPIDLSPTRSRHAAIQFLVSPKAGRVRAVHGQDAARRVPGIEAVTVLTRQSDLVRPPQNAYDRLGYLIAVGSSPADVQRAVESAAREVSIEVDDQ